MHRHFSLWLTDDQLQNRFLQRLKKENLGLVTKNESESHHNDPNALEGAVTNEEAEKVGVLNRAI